MNKRPSGEVTSLRLNADDRRALERIKKHGGFTSQQEAIKAAIAYTDDSLRLKSSAA